MAKFAKLVWLAAVQLFYFLSFFFFFSYNPNKKKREEKGPKAIFEKEWPKLMYVVMLSRKLNRRCPDQSGSRAILASWCCCSAPSQSFILHACCLLQQTKSHNTPSIAQAPICDEARLLPVLLPAIRWTKKKVQMCGLWTTKSTTRTQRRFSRYSKFHAKERSSDRSPVWRSLYIFCVKLRVIEKNVFVSVWCVLECSGNLFTSSTLFGKVNTHFYLIDYELHVSDTDVFFLPPFSLFSYFCYQTDYKKENSIEVWTSTMDVQNFKHHTELDCQ